MKNEFVEFIEKLIALNPKEAEELMTENIKSYIEILKNGKETSKSEITKNGVAVLAYLQQATGVMFKSRDIAEGMGISSRGVAGTMRKLVSDGFCEKVGQDPSVYVLTEKGKNYKIEE